MAPEVLSARSLHLDHRRARRDLVALVRVPGAALSQIHRESGAADGLSAGQLQSRWRRVDLDSRGLGGGGADGPRADRGPPRAVPAPANLSLDDDAHGPADRA